MSSNCLFLVFFLTVRANNHIVVCLCPAIVYLLFSSLQSGQTTTLQSVYVQQLLFVVFFLTVMANDHIAVCLCPAVVYLLSSSLQSGQTTTLHSVYIQQLFICCLLPYSQGKQPHCSLFMSSSCLFVVFFLTVRANNHIALCLCPAIVYLLSSSLQSGQTTTLHSVYVQQLFICCFLPYSQGKQPHCTLFMSSNCLFVVFFLTVRANNHIVVCLCPAIVYMLFSSLQSGQTTTLQSVYVQQLFICCLLPYSQGKQPHCALFMSSNCLFVVFFLTVRANNHIALCLCPAIVYLLFSSLQSGQTTTLQSVYMQQLFICCLLPYSHGKRPHCSLFMSSSCLFVVFFLTVRANNHIALCLCPAIVYLLSSSLQSGQTTTLRSVYVQQLFICCFLPYSQGKQPHCSLFMCSNCLFVVFFLTVMANDHIAVCLCPAVVYLLSSSLQSGQTTTLRSVYVQQLFICCLLPYSQGKQPHCTLFMSSNCLFVVFFLTVRANNHIALCLCPAVVICCLLPYSHGKRPHCSLFMSSSCLFVVFFLTVRANNHIALCLCPAIVYLLSSSLQSGQTTTLHSVYVQQLFICCFLPYSQGKQPHCTLFMSSNCLFVVFFLTVRANNHIVVCLCPAIVYMLFSSLQSGQTTTLQSVYVQQLFICCLLPYSQGKQPHCALFMSSNCLFVVFFLTVRANNHIALCLCPAIVYLLFSSLQSGQTTTLQSVYVQQLFICCLLPYSHGKRPHCSLFMSSSCLFVVFFLTVRANNHIALCLCPAIVYLLSSSLQSGQTTTLHSVYVQQLFICCLLPYSQGKQPHCALFMSSSCLFVVFFLTVRANNHIALCLCPAIVYLLFSSLQSGQTTTLQSVYVQQLFICCLLPYSHGKRPHCSLFMSSSCLFVVFFLTVRANNHIALCLCPAIVYLLSSSLQSGQTTTLHSVYVQQLFICCLLPYSQGKRPHCSLFMSSSCLFVVFFLTVRANNHIAVCLCPAIVYLLFSSLQSGQTTTLQSVYVQQLFICCLLPYSQGKQPHCALFMSSSCLFVVFFLTVRANNHIALCLCPAIVYLLFSSLQSGQTTTLHSVYVQQLFICCFLPYSQGKQPHCSLFICCFLPYSQGKQPHCSLFICCFLPYSQGKQPHCTLFMSSNCLFVVFFLDVFCCLDVGEDDFFKEFGCWGQEGNGSIGGALVGIFVWFGNRYYFC